MWPLLTNRRVLQAAAVMGVLLVVALWPEATEVKVGAVTRGALVVSLEAKGVTRVHHRFVVTTPVPGRLEAVELQPGNGVERGTTVVVRLRADAPPTLDPKARAEAIADVEAARSELKVAEAEEQRARAALTLAVSELQREQQAFDAGQTTRQSLEARRSLVGSAEESVNAAVYATAEVTQTLERARARLLSPRAAPTDRLVEVLAPVDGVVLQVLQGPDGTTLPAGTPVLEVGDPSHVEIVADLPPADAAKVKPGMRVAVDHWGGDTPLPAWVERVDSTPLLKKTEAGGEEPRVNVFIDFEDDRAAWNAMGEGFQVQVRVAIWEDDDVLRIPTNALFQIGEQWVTYAVQGNRARQVLVEIGERTDTVAEVRKGLRAGQQVVVDPPPALTDNARVAIRE